jgi:hypothetical protein
MGAGLHPQLCAWGLGVPDSAAWVIMIVLLTQEHGWVEWSPAQLQASPAVQQAVKACTSIDLAAGIEEAAIGQRLHASMFCPACVEQLCGKQSYAKLVQAIQTALRTFLADEKQYGLAELQSLSATDKDSRTYLSSCVNATWGCDRYKSCCMCTAFFAGVLSEGVVRKRFLPLALRLYCQ